MAIDLTKPLRKALAELQAEKERIDRQIAAIQRVLAAGSTRRQRARGRSTADRRQGRKPTSAAARKAASRRMKAYWAKRRADTAKEKGAAEK